MRIEIRSDSVEIDGYVNVVERDSRPLVINGQKCVETIVSRAFERALNNADNVDLLLNHDNNKKLGSTKEGNLTLYEDNIGLRAICTITDAEVIEKAKKKELQGWSFSMNVQNEEIEERAEKLPRRHVKELKLYEVSIIDTRMSPCYIATSIEMRGEKENEEMKETRAHKFQAVTINHEKKSEEKPDFEKYEKIIQEMKTK